MRRPPKCASESKAGRRGCLHGARWAGLEGEDGLGKSLAPSPISSSSFERRNIPRRPNGGASIDAGILRCRQGEKGVICTRHQRQEPLRDHGSLGGTRTGKVHSTATHSPTVQGSMYSVLLGSGLVCAGHAWSSGTLTRPPPWPKIAAKKSARLQLFLL